MIQRRLLALASVAVLVCACATQPATPPTVAAAIAHDPELSTLNQLVTKAGLAETLAAAGPYTVFAPTNAAFAAVPAKTLDDLGHDPARLKAVLGYHVLPAKVTAAEVKNGNARTLQGANLALSKAGEFVTVEDAMVQSADLVAGNGVVHKVDRVLMPPR